jgi:WD40 repeat protein
MPDMSANDEIPPSFKLLHALGAHENKINLIAWSPNGQMLASAFKAEPLHIWDVETESLLQSFEGNFNYSIVWSPDGKMLAAGGVYRLMLWNIETGKLHLKIRTQARANKSVAWSPDGRILASGTDDGSISLWDIKSGQVLRTLTGHSRSVNSVVWSPDGLMLASGSDDKTVRSWYVEIGKLRWMFEGHVGAVNHVAWSSNGKMLASASNDKTIRLWDPETKSKENIPDAYMTERVDSISEEKPEIVPQIGQNSDEKPEVVPQIGLKGILKGHTDAVICISFSSDGRLLASKSLDGTIRIWHSNTQETVTLLDEPSLPYGMSADLAFHPNDSILATVDEQDTAIRIWELDFASILGDAPIVYSFRYANAKVVLVGDTGVGKTGLSLVLTNQPFVPSESSHGRHVWPFYSKKEKLGSRSWELREIFLWDLAGQPNYRLMHHLHLYKATIALVVFDAHSETDPFAGVHYWGHALQQAQRVRGNSASPFKKFLVAARTDRGGSGVSQKNIDSLLNELGFDRYFRTSAKEEINIEELREAIREAVIWDNLPKVGSTDLFERVKNLVAGMKADGWQLSSTDTVYRMFLRSESAPVQDKEHRAQFEDCIEDLGSQGVIGRFCFGNHILLQPELLDAYASALINAVKDEPEGLGTIAEGSVFAGNFFMPEDERLEDKEQEKLLLTAMVEDLIGYEIALREQTDDQMHLVFPSLFAIEKPDLANPEGKTRYLEIRGEGDKLEEKF